MIHYYITNYYIVGKILEIFQLIWKISNKIYNFLGKVSHPPITTHQYNTSQVKIIVCTNQFDVRLYGWLNPFVFLFISQNTLISRKYLGAKQPQSYSWFTSDELGIQRSKKKRIQFYANKSHYHSAMFAPIAAKKPVMMKWISYKVHRTNPNIIGMSESWTRGPFFSFNMKYEMTTVNNGAELLTVSMNDTATYFNDSRLRKITINL